MNDRQTRTRTRELTFPSEAFERIRYQAGPDLWEGE